MINSYLHEKFKNLFLNTANYNIEPEGMLFHRPPKIGNMWQKNKCLDISKGKGNECPNIYMYISPEHILVVYMCRFFTAALLLTIRTFPIIKGYQ